MSILHIRGLTLAALEMSILHIRGLTLAACFWPLSGRF